MRKNFSGGHRLRPCKCRWCIPEILKKSLNMFPKAHGVADSKSVVEAASWVHKQPIGTGKCSMLVSMQMDPDSPWGEVL